MARHLKIATAQMGPNQEGASRDEIVERMQALLADAVRQGVELIGGSCIVSPLGQVVAKATTTGDELVIARVDLDQMAPVRKRWDFLGRRQPQDYAAVLTPVTEKEPHR